MVSTPASAASPAEKLLDSFGKDVFYNDVEVQVKLPGSNPAPMKRFLTMAGLLVQHSPKVEAQLVSWQTAQHPPSQQSKHGSSLADSATSSELASDCCGRRSSSGSFRRVAEVIVEDLADADVVEQCLRFVYNSKLPAQQLLVSQLLSMYRMADYLDMQACCAAVLAAMSSLPVASVSVQDAVALRYGSALPEHAVTAGVKELCKQALLHHLGDVVVLMRSETLKAQWLSLPHAALLDILQSEKLATDSEDSVVTAVSCWADKSSCDEVEKLQLLHSLRLIQLSSSYFYTVLPKLQWLQGGRLSISLYPVMMRLAAYVTGDAHVRMQAQLGSNGQSKLPEAWLEAHPRPVSSANGQHGSCAVLKSAHITRALLEQQLLPALRDRIQASQQADCDAQAGASESVLVPESLFAHGYCAGLSLSIDAKGQLGMYVHADVPAAHSEPSVSLGKPHWRLCYKLLCQTAGDAPGQHSLSTAQEDGGDCLNVGWGYAAVQTFPPDKPIPSLASWDDLLLVEGALLVKMEVQASKQRLLPVAPAALAALAVPKH